MKVHAVQPENISDWQEALDWHFSSFCRDGSLAPKELWQDIATSQRQLWVVTEGDRVLAAALTLIANDRLKTCDVTHGAGEAREKWQHLILALEHWAREIGCKRFRIFARLGWERIFRDQKFKKTHVVLERAL